MSLTFSSLLGMVIGLVLVVIPEPATTAIGLGILAFTAYKIGWMGK